MPMSEFLMYSDLSLFLLQEGFFVVQMTKTTVNEKYNGLVYDA